MNNLPAHPAERIVYLLGAIPGNYFTREWEAVETELNKMMKSNVFEVPDKDWHKLKGSLTIVAKALWLQVPHPAKVQHIK